MSLKFSMDKTVCHYARCLAQWLLPDAPHLGFGAAHSNAHRLKERPYMAKDCHTWPKTGNGDQKKGKYANVVAIFTRAVHI